MSDKDKRFDALDIDDGSKPTKFEETHISLVVDRSGSMADCWDDTMTAINGYLKEARADDNLKEADTEIMVFDSGSIDVVRTGTPITITDLNATEFPPRASTPLYDAIGRGVESLDARLTKAGSKKAVLVIATDGFENASRKYGFNDIKELIKGREAAGWLVVFLGAGLQAAEQGLALGLSAGKVASFGKSKAQLGATLSSVRGMSAGYAATQDFQEAQVYAASATFTEDERKAMDGGDQKGDAWGVKGD